MFEVHCSDCGATHECRAEQNGKMLRCDCGNFLIARDPNAPPEPEPDLDPTPPPMKVKPVTELPKRFDPPTPEPPVVIGVKQPSTVFPPRETPADVVKMPPSVGVPPPDNPVIGVKKVTPPPVAAPPPEPEGTVFVEAPPPKPKQKIDLPKIEMPKISLTPDQKMKAIFGGVGAVLLLLLLPVLFHHTTKVDPMPDNNSAAPASAAPSQGPATAPAQAATAAADCSANPMRLDNGTPVAHSLLGNGMGKLEVDNLTPTDVAVRLIGNDDLTVAWVYVQQGQSASIDNIPLGTHRLVYESGSDWDGQNLLFRCNPKFAVFDKAIEYKERYEDHRTSYSDYRVTLGKSRVMSISKEEFLKGHIGSPT